MALDSMKEIFDRMEQEGKPFWEIVLETDMDERQVTRNQSMAKMLITWQAMADAADSYTGRRKSVSGLVGGDGMKMRQYCLRGEAMSGGYVSEVIAEALSMAESNACMCRIVAAPTAGACGVLPAVLLPLCRYEELSQHQLLEALYVASGIGAVIAYRACIAGASGGCQAEIGTASAMAAGALVALRGGTGEQIGHAVAMALKNLMGLICDPVAGLVEVPCVKRNVIGAVNAVSVADMAMAGITSRIPVDEVIDAMGEVGRRMPVEFRETALGGLAVTPTGQAITERIRKSKQGGTQMTLDFNAVDPTVVPHFKGGAGEAHVRTAVADGMGRILTLTLPAGSSIGLHTHTGNCEIIHVLSGCGVCHDDGMDVPLTAGMTHYCPEGHTHGIDNTGDAPLVLLGILPDSK